MNFQNKLCHELPTRNFQTQNFQTKTFPLKTYKIAKRPRPIPLPNFGHRFGFCKIEIHSQNDDFGHRNAFWILQFHAQRSRVGNGFRQCSFQIQTHFRSWFWEQFQTSVSLSTKPSPSMFDWHCTSQHRNQNSHPALLQAQTRNLRTKFQFHCLQCANANPDLHNTSKPTLMHARKPALAVQDMQSQSGQSQQTHGNRLVCELPKASWE